MELTSLAIDLLRQLIKVAIGSSLQPRSVLGGQPIKMLMTLVKCLNKELLGQALEISLERHSHKNLVRVREAVTLCCMRCSRAAVVVWQSAAHKPEAHSDKHAGLLCFEIVTLSPDIERHSVLD